jgi:hypothetical protein
MPLELDSSLFSSLAWQLAWGGYLLDLLLLFSDDDHLTRSWRWVDMCVADGWLLMLY